MKRLFIHIDVLLIAVLCLCCFAGSMAHAQQLAISPGTAENAVGDGSYATPSVYNYSGPVSGYEPGTSNLSGTAVDAQGNLYFFDGAIHVIPSGKGTVPVLANSNEPNYVASPQMGNIYLVAGNGTASPSSGCTGTTAFGDGCYAAQAALPQNQGQNVGLAVDVQGNLYLADGADNEIRVIYAAGSIPGLPSNPEVGRIYAIAGTGTAGSNGDAGSALNAELNDPAAVVVDNSGNVYIADSNNAAVRILYAGKGSIPGLPSGAQAGSLYTIVGILGSSCTNSASNSPCGDGQIATEAQLHGPQGIALDGSGNLYVADTLDFRLRVVYVSGNIPGISNPIEGDIYTVAGTGTPAVAGGVTAAPATSISVEPISVAIDAGGNVYVANTAAGANGDTYADRIDVAGAVTPVMGGGNSSGSASCQSQQYDYNGCPAYMVYFYTLVGVTVDANNNLYIVDSGGPVIYRLDALSSSLSFIETIGFSASQPVYAYNIGAKPVNLSSINFTGNFTQASTGNTDCGDASQIQPGATCTVQTAYVAKSVGSDTGILTISSDSVSGANAVQLAGTAAQSSSRTVLAVSNPLIGTGQPVTLTATVFAPTGSSLSPTGTVNFQNGTTVLGTASLNGGTATFTTSNLPAGMNAVFASYGGDANFVTSASYAHSVKVSSLPIPTVTLTASSTSANLGAAVTFTAAVTGSGPTGMVSFQIGSVILGTVSLNGGTATFTTSALLAGLNTVYASYGGDSSNSAQISNGVIVTVTTPSRAELVPGIISTVATLPLSASALTTDTYDNVYYDGSVKASGKGPIPGVAQPVAGNTYSLLGSGNCGGTGGVCGIPGPASGAVVGLASDFEGIQVDAAGDVYFLALNRLYRIDAATDYVTDVTPSPVPAANGSSPSAPMPTVGSFFLDNENNIYIADTANKVISRQDALTGVLTVVAGTAGQTCGALIAQGGSAVCGDGGPATSSFLLGPLGIYVDGVDNLFILDGSVSVRRVDAKTGIITTVAGAQNRQSCGGAGQIQTGCGDGGAATSAYLQATQVFGDVGGNLYIADAANESVRKIDASGTIYNIAGITGDTNSVYAGDGIAATSANLYQPSLVALNSQGNIYITDQQAHVFQVTAGTSIFNYAEADAGPGGMQVLTLSNTSSTPLHTTGLSFADGFVQQATGGTSDCTGMDTIAPGFSCHIGIAFFPDNSGQVSGSLNITDDSINAVSGQNVVTLSGTAATGQVNTIIFAALPDVTYGTGPVTLNATASSGLAVSFAVSGPAAISGNTITITAAGQVTITAYQFGGDGSGYAPAKSVSQSFKVNPAALMVTANSFSCLYGQVTSCLAANPLSYSITGFVNGDTSSIVSGVATLTDSVNANSPTGTYPITFATQNLSASNYTFTYVPGTLNITGNEVQTINFGSLSGVTYGAAPISLNANASSGLPVSYTATGPATVSGTILSVTGAGVVTVTAQQGGNATYAAAIPVSQSFVVTKAVLAITANNQTLGQGNSPAPFTTTITGYVNGDSSSVVTGNPAFNTNASSTSPIGTYPLMVSQGTLSASNYTFTFVSGTITVIAGTAQTINFTPIPTLTYGVGPVPLTATATSGLPVSFTVIGPAHLTNNVLNLTGAGMVVVTANQSGGSGYSAASPVVQTITVQPAVLTVTANNITRVNNVPNPPLTYTITGFVNGDTATVVGGFPSGSTTATPGSAVGTYPIQLIQSSLTAINYTFVEQGAVLTITNGGPTPDYSLSATPQVLTMVPGQTRQTTVTLTPVNFFQGSVSLQCGTLPAHMSCIFSPTAFNADGSGTPVSVTLTINTDGSSPVVGTIKSEHFSSVAMASLCWLPAGICGLVLACGRRRLVKHIGARSVLLVLLLLLSGMGVTACGGSSPSATSQYTSPGTSTVTVTAAGTSSNGIGVDTHTLNMSVEVQGAQ